MTFDIEAAYAVGAAQMGDLAPIIARLENPDTKLEQIERKWLADNLRGKGQGRPSQPRGWKEAHTLAVFAWSVEIEGYPIEAAKNRAAHWCGVSEPTVDRWRKAEKTLQPLAALMLAAWKTQIFQAKAGHLSAEDKDELRKEIFQSLTK